MKVISTAFLIVLSPPAPALAWGDEGHRIAAEIAERHLNPATVRQVRELLAIENATTLAEVSTWADEIRGQRRETARWHYVNIPIHPPPGAPAAYDAARDCPRGDCVVAAIGRFSAVLRDMSAAPRERLEALKWVVYFVADVHQPLHCADDGDRGGNAISVTFGGRQTNLHAVWDWGILAPVAAGDERDYALRLIKAITPAELATWSAGRRHRLGKRELRHGEWPHAPGPLPATYEAGALPIVNAQIDKAGVRLAAVLKASLP